MPAFEFAVASPSLPPPTTTTNNNSNSSNNTSTTSTTYHLTEAVTEAAVTAIATADVLPSTMATLRAAFDCKQATGFHTGHFPQGHRATDYTRFFGNDGDDGDSTSHGTSHGTCSNGTCSNGTRSNGGGGGSKGGASGGVKVRSLCYPVEYELHFEPYVMMRREDVPSYDERFRGYGMNKISRTFYGCVECVRRVCVSSVFVECACAFVCVHVK